MKESILSVYIFLFLSGLYAAQSLCKNMGKNKELKFIISKLKAAMYCTFYNCICISIYYLTQQCVCYMFGGKMNPYINILISLPLAVTAGIVINKIEKEVLKW